MNSVAMRNHSRGAKNDCFQINMNRITGLSALYSPHSGSRCTLFLICYCISLVHLCCRYQNFLTNIYTFTTLSGFGQGLDCNTKFQLTTVVEAQWAGGRDSQMTQTAAAC